MWSRRGSKILSRCGMDGSHMQVSVQSGLNWNYNWNWAWQFHLTHYILQIAKLRFCITSTNGNCHLIFKICGLNFTCKPNFDWQKKIFCHLGQGTRDVKTCLWFRKHNFWYQSGSSNFAGNFCQNDLSNCSNSFYIVLPKAMDWLRAKSSHQQYKPPKHSASYNAPSNWEHKKKDRRPCSKVCLTSVILLYYISVN